MKVLILSTSDKTGGGAIAAHRLMGALRGAGVDATMLVRDCQTPSPLVRQVGNILPKVWERMDVLLHNGFRRQTMWLADTACCGIDVTQTEEYRQADVIHLHWVCQGMLSLSALRRILRSGKKVVWTLHDEWPYLGVCHYRGTCTQAECRQCPLIGGGRAHRIYKQKRSIYSEGRITMVGCSRWITEQAAVALPGVRVEHINNCIPSAEFHPIDRSEARHRLGLPEDARLVLFCSQKVSDERKGMSYLIDALRMIPADYHLLVVGKGAEQIRAQVKCAFTSLGEVSVDRMPLVYAAADVFVTPSLQDNLPNTIAEAMSMGTPCVGFRVGGIPEMILHKQNGYVAEYRDAKDLAAGIEYVLTHPLGEAARQHALQEYAEDIVAAQYINIYNDL